MAAIVCGDEKKKKKKKKKKSHALMIPFPAQGHITPMLKLAELLHHKGFYITFVHTEYNRDRLVRSRGPESVAGLEDFRFETIPDGLPPSDSDHQADVDGTQDIPSLCLASARTCLAPFRSLLSRLNDRDTGAPPLTCVVADGVMSFALDAAEELRIPCVLFWTTSACGFMAYIHFKDLLSKGLVPLTSTEDITNGYLDTPVDFVAGMKNIMRLRDFPSFIRSTDPDDVMLDFVIRETSRATRASAIILNTFDDLERPVLDALSINILPPLYTVGPLHLLINELLPPDSPVAASAGPSLWKEDTSCLDWLDGKKSASVIYVNFGSITVMTNEQLVEFAWGLANSGAEFLWVIRPDLVRGDDAVLPLEFTAETKGRGMLASWCAQEAVLSHPAVGGFLTHSGWNSTLESISAGVPMVCWPFFAEQQTNCRYACAEWGVGVEIDAEVRREEVEVLIRELTEGAKGKEMRDAATKLGRRAAKAAEPGGSSFQNLCSVVQEVLLQPLPISRV